MSWFFLIILNTRHSKLLPLFREREKLKETELYSRDSPKKKTNSILKLRKKFLFHFVTIQCHFTLKMVAVNPTKQ